MSMDRFGEKVCCNPTVKLKMQETYPLIDIDKITPGYKFVRSVESVDYTGQSGAKFQDHDVLFARITPCLENGKVAIADTDGRNGTGSTELFVFRGIDGVSDTDYIYYLLNMKHIRQLAANSMTGASGRQRADLGFIKRIQWNFPSVDIQKKIVSILSAYDNLIEVNNKRIKALEQMAENLYKEWFVRFRFPGHETAEFENGIPKGWVTKTLNEWMVDNFNGGWGEEIAMPKTHNEAAVIRGTDIEDVKASRYCDVPLRYHKENEIKTKLLKKNDIILELSNGNINNIGRTLFITKEILSHFDKVICASFCKTLRFSDVRVAFFVWQYIEYLQNSGIMFFYKNTGANGINNFNFKRFLRMPISIPNDMEIVEKMMCFHNDISAIREKNFNLIKQRDLLLPRLMSGKLKA